MSGLGSEDVSALVAGKSLEELQYLPIELSLDPPEDVDVEAVCVELSSHEDIYVRGNAILGFGHLSRTFGELDEAIVKPIVEAAMHDQAPFVCGHAHSAADDLTHFLGWVFQGPDTA